MAQVPCKACGELVNKRASKCPECGVSSPGYEGAVSAKAGCLVFLVLGAVIVGVLFATSGPSNSPPPLQPKKVQPTTTALTAKANAIYRQGMSRSDVINELGKPTFALLPTDKTELAQDLQPGGFSLFWDNGDRCSPVEVSFDKQGRATGMSAAKMCNAELTRLQKQPWSTAAWKRAACTNLSRAKYCK